MWLVVDAMLEVVLSGLSGRNYAHYFISWLPWMALAFALPFGHVVRTMRAWGRASQVLAIMAGLTIAVGGMRDTMSEYGATFSKLFKEDALVQRREVLAEYVNAHTAPGDTVLVWGGGAGLNFLSRRDSPSAYFTYGILSASPITRDLSAAFYTDILERPPALIVDESAGDLRYIVPALSELSPVEWSESMQVDVQPYVEELFAYFRTHYELKTTVAGIPIYSRSR